MLEILATASLALAAAGPHGITNGADTDGDPAVVAIVDDGNIVCTGILVAPDAVVTAAHCADLDAPLVLFGSSLADGHTRAVTDQIPHPDYDPDTLARDIAVLRLATPAPDAIAPAPVHTGGFDDSLIGAPIRLVGFGLTSLTDLEPQRKREGTTVVDGYDALTFSFRPQPSQTCLGDSGGPAFAEIDGVEVVLGVTSMGDPRCEERGIDTRVDAHLAFIREHAGLDGGGCAATRRGAGGTVPLVALALLYATRTRRRDRRGPRADETHRDRCASIRP